MILINYLCTIALGGAVVDIVIYLPVWYFLKFGLTFKILNLHIIT